MKTTKRQIISYARTLDDEELISEFQKLYGEVEKEAFELVMRDRDMCPKCQQALLLDTDKNQRYCPIHE